MLKNAAAGQVVRASVRRVFAVLLLFVTTAVLVGVLMLTTRYLHMCSVRDGDAISHLGATTVYAQSAPKTGRFTAAVDYTDLAAPGDTRVSCDLLWDDNWFFQDATVYNSELAYACAVLSALAYSESGHYQKVSAGPDYMEQALERLGFDAVDTSSYQFRSEIIDETLRLVTRESDACAYTIARKHLVADDGARRTLLLVSVRGSYGSEWISNLNMIVRDGASSELLEHAGLDHPGYDEATEEIRENLAPWIERAHASGEGVELLVVGHSRGGAIANLLGAQANEGHLGLNLAARAVTSTEGSSPADAVRAYTFATPATTIDEAAGSAAHANIFNVLNPSDLMPYLPLSSWGYRRYGTDVSLPRVGDGGFEARYAAMCASFAEHIGRENPSDPNDAEVIDEILSDVATSVRSVEDLMTPVGIASVVGACALRVDPVRMLYSHYPSVYVAWLESCGQ